MLDDLAPETRKALDDFLKEQAERKLLEVEQIQNKRGLVAQFEEDWQLSQFWYDEETKNTLGNIVKQLVVEGNASSTDYRIALLSCPSLYKTVKDIYDKVNIFEYDKRFAAMGDDFIYYDFNEGENDDYLKHLHHQYQLIIADPPFLSEECITKTCKIIINLLKNDKGKIIFCSGAIVEKWLSEKLNVKKSSYQPQHEHNLGNEFACYANFDLDKYIR